MGMPLKAVFFDIDGTLVDFDEFHVQAWQEAFQDAGHWLDKDMIRVQIGKGADKLISCSGTGLRRTPSRSCGTGAWRDFSYPLPSTD